MLLPELLVRGAVIAEVGFDTVAGEVGAGGIGRHVEVPGPGHPDPLLPRLLRVDAGHVGDEVLDLADTLMDVAVHQREVGVHTAGPPRRHDRTGSNRNCHLPPPHLVR